MKKKQIVLLFFSLIAIASCGNQEKNQEPITFESALKQAYGPRLSEVSDTLALGYHWGMSKNEAKTHIKELAKEGKVKYKNYKGYVYPMPLTHYDTAGNKTEDYVFRVSTETYRDTIKSLNLWLKGKDNNHSGYDLTTEFNDLTVDDLYEQFGTIFKERGFLCNIEYVGITSDGEILPGVPRAKWKGKEYQFVKGNTLIRIWRGDDWLGDWVISYYDLSLIFSEQCEIAAKEAAAAKKAAEENAARESKKKEHLSDF